MSKQTLWHRIALGLSILNVAGFGQAVGVAEPVHAGIHAVLALAFAGWAWTLRGSPPASQFEADVQSLADEVSALRQELTEAQERLDFTERLLAQERDVRRVEPER
ncbi:MAG: hypothetical protein ACREMH_09940 [Gemmatimonadales bacterium]